MSDLINEYISDLEATKHISPLTESLYLLELGLFREFVKKELLVVERKDVLAFFSSLHGKIQGSTVNKKKRIIKSFYAWLEEQEKIDRTPFYKLKFEIKKTHKTYRVLTTQEIKSLLLDGWTLRKINKSTSKTAFKRLRGQCVIRVFIATGIRRKELISLEIQDCHIKNRTLSIRNTKTKRDRNVYFDRDTAIWLEIYLNKRKNYARGDRSMFINFEGEALDEDRIDGIVGFRFWKAGLKGKFEGVKEGKGMGTHTFRRTWATHTLRNGADLRTIQLLLGHSNIETTAKYLFPSDEDIKNTYDATNIIGKINGKNETKKKKKSKKKSAPKKDTPKPPSSPTFDEGLL